MTALVEFEKFLLSAFSAGELRRFIGYLPDGARLATELPGPNVSKATLTHDAVWLLKRTGDLRDPVLWDALIAERGGRASEIRALRAKIVSTGASATTTNLRAANPPASSSNASLGAVRKILFVSASPERASQLAVDREFRKLHETLRAARNRDRFALEVRPAADYDTLEAALRVSKPHILHLSCHGDAAGNLHLADDRDETEELPAEMFIDLLKRLPGNLELVVLNACNSDVIARQLPPIVAHAVGMRDALNDEAAIDFTRKLYENLADDVALADAFALACNKLRKHDAHESPRLFGE